MTSNDWHTRLHSLPHRSFEEVRNVGVAILCRPKTSQRNEVRHVGVLYRTQRYGASTIHLLHLADHKKTVRGDLKDDYAWVEPAIPRPRARVLAVQCARIMERYESSGLPYGLRYAGARFVDGEFKPAGEIGLTCSTFVLAIFASVGVQLLRTEEWCLRIDDIDDKRRIIGNLRDAGAGSYVEALESNEELAAPRFRPEEVAAAGTVDGPALPLGFRDAEKRGKAIAEELFRRTSAACS